MNHDPRTEAKFDEELIKPSYRQQQIDNLQGQSEYSYAIQLRNNASGVVTTWLNISENELEAIRSILWSG